MGRPIELARMNHFVPEAEVAGNLERELTVPIGVAGTIRRHGDGAHAERLVGDKRQIRAVDATTERDDRG